MVANWIIQIAIAVAMTILSYVLTPKPKGPKPEAVQEAENPTAEAGRPIPVLFGTKIVKEVNVLGFWDKSSRQFKIKV